MNDAALRQALDRMREDGAGAPVLAAFERRFAQLQDPRAGMLPGDVLEPVPGVPALDDLDAPDPGPTLDRVAVIKLNGGLGTSMGLRGPKSLVQVKPGATFLDVIAMQIRVLRARHGARLPLVLLNSFSTRDATLAALHERHADLEADVPLDLLQSREPKLRADSQAPVDWPDDPALEWCPPGHGDLYVSLAASGMLARLRAAGYDWAFVSNSDNLGAEVEPRIPAWADGHDIPFVMEVVRGTPADRKGGHIALRDGRLVLRETAQTPPDDASFTDVERWRFYNSNNLWVDLRALERLLQEQPAGPDLPLIVNRKTVDPGDPSSPDVLQLETAMGAAIGAIDGARAVLVPRTRFAPVKTTDDLLVVRSDAYMLTDDGHLSPAFDGQPPVVALDPGHYRLLPDMERRLPDGPPSLRHARGLTVHGDVTFGAGVTIEGTVELDGPARIPDGQVLRG